jgi:16S rRNA (guanine(527)-N(7))-methyltransferase RsmG
MFSVKFTGCDMIEINEKSFYSILTKTFGENGMSSLLTKDVCDKFYRLTVRMLEENEKYNLTAITEPSKIILNHYADCAVLAKRLKKGASVVDVGCGAGFPTLPVAILRPDLKILAMDSTAKRINYVSETAALLGLTNVTAITLRAEEGGIKPEYREKFDYATARAVAEMRVLSELCLPYVKIGGEFIAMKGKNAEFELSAAKKAIATLGGRNTKLEEISLKGEGEALTHPLISVEKKEKTPALYPRVFAQISKKPL